MADFSQRKSITEDMFFFDTETPYIYNGEEHTPEVSAFDSEYELTAADYDVDYDNNVNVGTASISITGKGQYQGILTLTFDIVRQLNVVYGENNRWASYLAAEDLVTPENINAYIVTGVQTGTVTVSKIDYIPQGVAVMLELTTLESPEVLLAGAYDGEVLSFNGNLLQGCATATAVSTLTADNDVYVLYNDEFVKTTSGQIPASRCYLPLAKGAAGARLAIAFDDESTAVHALTVSPAQRNAVYNVSGLRVTRPSKGLYIVDGKKVVVK